MPKDDSDDEDIWDYPSRHWQKSRSSQISKDIDVSVKTCSGRGRGRTKSSKANDSTQKKPKEREKKTTGRKSTNKAAESKKQTANKSAKDENENKISLSQTSETNGPSKKVKANTRKQQKTPKPRDKGSWENAEKHSGFCPICQMPYTALSIVQSPNWHISECLETPYTSKKECPLGLDCDNTIASHYKKFHHRALARHRARLKSGEPVTSYNLETKRKIEFEQSSGKENIPTKLLPENTYVETVRAEEDVPDCRDVDQMLMDALDDNVSENETLLGKSQSFKSLVSQNDIYEKNITDTCIPSQKNSKESSSDQNMQQCVVEINNVGCAIIVSDSDVVDNSGAIDMNNRPHISDDNMLGTHAPNDESIKGSDSSLNTPFQKEDNMTSPSFFELSQSAQKQGFFAKKRRQNRNQKSAANSVEEVPPKKARKGTGTPNKSKGNKESETKTMIKQETQENASGDRNSDLPNKSSQLDTVATGTSSQEHLCTESANECVMVDDNEEVKDLEKEIESECDIKIQDIRSGASDIFFGGEPFTSIVDKPTNKVFDIADPCLIDDISSDSMSSSDIFESDSEPDAPKMDNKRVFEEVNEDSQKTSGDTKFSYYSKDSQKTSGDTKSSYYSKDSQKTSGDTKSSYYSKDSQKTSGDTKSSYYSKDSQKTSGDTKSSYYSKDSQKTSGDTKSSYYSKDSQKTSGDTKSSYYSKDTGSEDSSGLETTLEVATSVSEDKLEATTASSSDKNKDELGKNISDTAKPSDYDKKPSDSDEAKRVEDVQSKPSTLMNAFSILMTKGKSLIGRSMTGSFKATTAQKGKPAVDINVANKTKQNVQQKETGMKRELPVKSYSWTDAKSSDDATSSSYNDQSGRRSCPFYKKIPGTPFTVDAFRYGNIPDCRAYFLTHFHYDHYGGLTRKFCGPIYCSQVTLNLVKSKLKVEERYLHHIPLNTPKVVEGVEVTFLDANHCPGSVLILFRLKNGKVYLHTGDFRANSKMEVYPSLVDLHVHTLYLDTTYCDPQYTFPPQEDVVSYAVQLALDARTANPRTLIVCGSYTIGKEKIFTAIADALNCKICVTRDKKMVLDCLDDMTMKARVSMCWQDSGLHVLPMNKLNYKGLEDHLKEQGQKYDCVLAMEPTGWTCNKKFKSLQELKPKMKNDRITLYGIPYSEHSSYLEMKQFVQFIRPDKILPTVNNGNAHSRKKMEVIFESWNDEIRHGKVK